MDGSTENTTKEEQLAEMLAYLGKEVHLLTSLLEGGHIELEDAYYKVKDLWRQTKKTKRELFPEMSQGDEE